MQREVALKCTSRAGIRWGGERDERLPLARLAFAKAQVSGRRMRDRALAIVRTPTVVLPIGFAYCLATKKASWRRESPPEGISGLDEFVQDGRCNPRCYLQFFR